MHSPSAPILLSPLDEERFGYKSARAGHVTTETWPLVLEFCRDHRVQFLIVRCATTDLGMAHQIESAGGHLMDTLVYYTRDLRKRAIPDTSATTTIRPIQPADEHAVAVVAADIFQGYFGHYHADPRLDQAQCDAVYTSWAQRSAVSRSVADEVLVAEQDGRIAGFATLRINNPDEGEGVLFGVAPWAQGQGIYQSFMIAGMRWCRGQDAQRMVVSTQITTIAVQKVWSRLNFEPSHALYTFHVWFDGEQL